MDDRPPHPDALHETLLRILGVLASAAPLAEQLARIHAELWTLLDASNLYVAVYDQDSGLYTFPYNADPDDQDFAPQALRESLTDYVRRTATPLLCRDEDHRRLQAAGEVGAVIGLGAPIWLGVPLIGERGCFGVVVVQHYTDGDALDEEDVPVFAWAARCMGVAVERQWRSEQLQAASALRLRDLELSRDEALRANQAKTTFLANMSHELRTPLHAVLGYADLILESHGDRPELVADLTAIRAAAHHLRELIDGVLDYTALDAGLVEPSFARFPVAELFTALESATGPLAPSRRDTLLFVGGAEAGEVVTDRTMLLRALTQLVVNALKFTSDGIVVVRARREVSGSGEQLRFEVSDTGIGVDPAVLPRLFEPFTQADASFTRVHGGTGLGLPIARALAGLLGGALAAASVPGRGSTFSLTIPSTPIVS